MSVKKHFVIVRPVSIKVQNEIKSFLLLQEGENIKIHFKNSIKKISSIATIINHIILTEKVSHDDIKFITSRYHLIYDALKQQKLLYRSLQSIVSKMKKISLQRENSIEISSMDVAKNTIIVLGEGDFSEKQSNFAHQTGQTGKEYSFIFVSVVNGQYCNALRHIDKLILSGNIVSIYVFSDDDTSSRFIGKLRRNLNRCMTRLVTVLEKNNIKSFLVDLEKGITESFFKLDTSDKKEVIKKRAA